MRTSYDVAIAGGGIVGAACAAECAAAGLKVVVVEPGPIGGGATAAGMGHLVVMDDSPAQIALTHYSRNLWIELRRELPADVEYLRGGTLWVAADEEEMAEVRAQAAASTTSIGVRAEVLDARELAEAEPHLRPGLAGGLLVPDDAVIYPPCAARYLWNVRANGAILRWARATQLTRRRHASCAMARRVSAGITVNATGAWAPELTPGIEVRKRKGHLVITDRYPGLVRHQSGGTGLSQERALDHARIRWRSTCSRARRGRC